jgi:hypothetical protein
MIAALVSTAAMSIGAVAVAFGAHPLVGVVAFGLALAVIAVRPWRDADVSDLAQWVVLAIAVTACALDQHLYVRNANLVPDLIAVAILGTVWWRRRRASVTVVLALLAWYAVATSLVGGTAYHSDAVVAAHAGAQRVLAGQHPYEGFDLIAELSRFGLPPEYATPLEDGTRLRLLQYPVLTVLVPAPFIALGLPDIRVLYLIEVLAIFGVLLFRAPVTWRPLVLACCVGNLVVLDQFVNAGVDPLWALLLLGAWVTRVRRWSAVLLGLAVATRQPAWLVAPFVIAWTWRALGAHEALARAAIAVAVALAVHLPFLMTAPAAVIGGMTAPALLPLEPWGIGPSKLLADTVGPVVPRAIFLAGAAAAYVAALWAFAMRRSARGALVLPLVPLWLSWRALQSYFAFLPLFALATDRSEDQIDARSGSPGARLV